MPRSDRPAGPAAAGRVVRPARRTAAVALALLLAGPGAAAPAAAHDVLLATAPADGARLDAPPTQVTLTFSADQIEVGTAVRVVDAAGAEHADGAPLVDGATVTQPLTELAPGAYEVVWRSVSSDGHTLDGTFAFEVAGEVAPPSSEPGAEATPTPTSEPTSAPTTPGTDAEQDEAAAPAEEPAGDGAGGVLPVVLGVVGLGAVAAVVALLVRRRRA